MSSSEKLKPRDSTKPSSYYLKVATVYRRAIAAAIKLESPAVLNTIADYYLRVARALYSAGVSTRECKSELAKAAQYFMEHLSASQEHPLHGIPNMGSYLENMGAACLTGTIGPCMQRLRTMRVENLLPWQASILSLIGAAFEGKDKLVGALDVAGAPSEYGPRFTDLFLAVVRKDRERFGPALGTYLTQVWGPPLDRSAKYDLDTKPPSYTGKWAFFLAALCSVMHEVPSLPRRAMEYVPVDLVEVDRGTDPQGNESTKTRGGTRRTSAARRSPGPR
jgi:hypothetical protein